MKDHNKNEKKSPFPPDNVSVNYYTDPIYSTDAFYGYEDDSGAGKEKQENNNGDALDEPIESWGWVNNTECPKT